MTIYIITILFSMITISTINIFLFNFSFNNYATWTFIAVLLSTIAIIIIDGILALIIHSFPDKWFNKNKKCFFVHKNERYFYEKLHIKSWKDKIPELGKLGGFKKNKMNHPNNLEYLKKFIIENNKGVTIHLTGAFFGFLVIFILPLRYAFRIGFWIACVNGILNLLPTFVLRYNNYKLNIVIKRAEKYSASDEIILT